MNMTEIAKALHSAKLLIEIASEQIVVHEGVEDGQFDAQMDMIDHALSDLKKVCDEIASGSTDFCLAYVAARDESYRLGREMAEKYDREEYARQMLILSGDNPDPEGGAA
jgi:hypothetical protein